MANPKPNDTQNSERRKGKGTWGPLPRQFTKGSTQFFCFEHGEVQLLSYTGRVEDAWLESKPKLQLYPAVPEGPQNLSLRQHFPEALHLTASLTAGVTWKVQFGKSLMVFVGPPGLPKTDVDKYENQMFTEAVLRDLLDKPKRSSFTPLTFAEMDELVKFLEEDHDLGAKPLEHTFTVRIDTKDTNKQLTTYQRIAESQEDMLDDREVMMTIPPRTNIYGNYTFVLPAWRHQEAAEYYLLFRTRIVGPRSNDSQARARVYKDDTGTRAEVNGEQVEIKYVRYEERRVLSVGNFGAEIHVTARKEGGLRAPLEQPAVRMELHCPADHTRQENWEPFIDMAIGITKLLSARQ